MQINAGNLSEPDYRLRLAKFGGDGWVSSAKDTSFSDLRHTVDTHGQDTVGRALGNKPSDLLPRHWLLTC